MKSFPDGSWYFGHDHPAPQPVQESEQSSKPVHNGEKSEDDPESDKP